MSMVEVGIWLVVIVILLILSIGLQLEGRYSGQKYLTDYDGALEEIQNSMNIVAQVLHKLPEMVPQMNLINQNPLTQILEFFQQRQQQASLGADQLRDDNGRFETDGTKEEQEITET